jgi:elongation factor P
MAQTSEIKKGVAIRKDGEIYIVSEFQHINPGKGAAFVRSKMKGLTSGKSIETTYKVGENVDVVDVQFQNMQYLYKSGEFYTFMNSKDYEQYEMNGDFIGDDAKYLKDNLEVVIGMYDGRPISIQLPKKITYKVTESPEAVRGDSSAGNVSKEAVMENGLKVQVPLFIKEGEEILVNTDTGDYSARVNN